MTANLTAQYRTAESKYREANSNDDKRAALEEMLSTIPKHKGTEKLQADIKRRLARLRLEVERHTRKKGPSMHVDPEGAAQVLLLGRPNSGKSRLLESLTRAVPTVAEYPFSTTRPQPGMLLFEDVQIQLVDLPPITAEHMDGWIPSLTQSADAAVLFADPDSPGVLTGVEEVVERLAAVHTPLVGELPEECDPRDLPLLTLMVISKADLASDDDMEVVEELYGDTYRTVRYSAETGAGREELKMTLWAMLGLVRVYTKPPGKHVQREDPFVLPEGSSIVDLASRVHHDLADRLAYARVWGDKLQGMRVARDFELRDRDVVELAT